MATSQAEEPVSVPTASWPQQQQPVPAALQFPPLQQQQQPTPLHQQQYPSNPSVSGPAPGRHRTLCIWITVASITPPFLDCGPLLLPATFYLLLGLRMQYHD